MTQLVSWPKDKMTVDTHLETMKGHFYSLKTRCACGWHLGPGAPQGCICRVTLPREVSGPQPLPGPGSNQEALIREGQPAGGGGVGSEPYPGGLSRRDRRAVLGHSMAGPLLLVLLSTSLACLLPPGDGGKSLALRTAG